MKIRILSLLLIVLGALLLSGCYGGGSTGLNPVVNFKFPAGTTLPAWKSTDVLVIDGEAKDPEATNPVTTYEWTQSPAGAGTFSSTATFGTTWKSRALAPGEVSNVTLSLTTRTKLGGKTVTPINLIVTP
jgi:hypothetical protein